MYNHIVVAMSVLGWLKLWMLFILVVFIILAIAIGGSLVKERRMLKRLHDIYEHADEVGSDS